MYRRYYDDDGELPIAVMNWALIILFIVYLLSVGITLLVLRYVVNPLLHGKLDEDDYLVLVSSTGLWALMGLLFAPMAAAMGVGSGGIFAALTAVLLNLVAALVGGGSWGLLVGFGVVLWLWWHVPPPPPWEPVPGFTRVTKLPVEHYLAAEDAGPHQSEPTLEELEEMILQQAHAAAQKEPAVPASHSRNGPEPAPTLI